MQKVGKIIEYALGQMILMSSVVNTSFFGRAWYLTIRSMTYHAQRTKPFIVFRIAE